MDKIIKKIQCMPNDQLQKLTNRLQMYNIAFYNDCGEFSYCDFQSDCIETINHLLKNEKPHPITNLRYKLSYLIGTICAIIGIRNLNKFIGS